MSHEKQELYKFLADLAFKKVGIYYDAKDYYRLDSRIHILLGMYVCKSEAELLLLLKNKMNLEMETQIIDICTNNETYFFRDINPFKALTEIYKEYCNNQFRGLFSIWSAAASTGQEALSILMTLRELNPPVDLNLIQLDATDISSQVLAKAKKGIYSNLDVQRGLSIQLLMKYFTDRPDGAWCVKPELLNRINYNYFNLLDSNYPVEKYNVIFCRNVLIYQTMEKKEEILGRMVKALKPGGHIIFGAGESLIGTNVKLKQIDLSGTMVFKKVEASDKKVA